MNNQDDIDLLQRIAQADTTALSLLYDQYGRLIFSIAFQVVDDTVLAEEITQDVFIQVWKKAASYDPSQGKALTWLTSITRHRSIDQIRRRNVRPEGSSVAWEDCCDDHRDESAPVELGLIAGERRTSLLRALESLPADQRKALSLAYFNGLTQQEIAETLREPLGTVKTRIRLALQKLRGALSAQSIQHE